jgi:hypothetical protein
MAGGYLDANNVLHAFLLAPDRTLTPINIPAAGTGAFQGVTGGTQYALNSAGAFTGWYVDTGSVSHGFVRAPDGTITTFDAPGAGADPGEGTLAFSINPSGAISGFYVDSSMRDHGFLYSDGSITTFDVPGQAPAQGTFIAGYNPAGTVNGYYVDANNVSHGFTETIHFHSS